MYCIEEIKDAKDFSLYQSSVFTFKNNNNNNQTNVAGEQEAVYSQFSYVLQTFVYTQVIKKEFMNSNNYRAPLFQGVSLKWSEVRERTLANFSLSDSQLCQAGFEKGMDLQKGKQNSMTVFWLADISVYVN